MRVYGKFVALHAQIDGRRMRACEAPQPARQAGSNPSSSRMPRRMLGVVIEMSVVAFCKQRNAVHLRLDQLLCKSVCIKMPSTSEMPGPVWKSRWI